MTRIKITRSLWLRGVSHNVGDIIEVSEADAGFLLMIGKAILAQDEPFPGAQQPL